jgi:O-antigen/teichoic acid export membrane protein
VALGFLLLIPIQSTLLTKEIFGVWYIFTALSSLAIMICQNGVTPTITRVASYLMAGSHSLDPHERRELKSNGPNWIEIISLHRTTRGLAILLGAAGATVVGGIGYLFIFSDAVPSSLHHQCAIGWTIQVFGIGILISASILLAFIQGLDGMLHSQKALFIARTVCPIVTILGLYNDLGIYSLGAGTAAMGITLLCSNLRFISRTKKQTKTRWTPAKTFRSHIRYIWPTVWRFSLVNLGTWLILLSSTVIAGVYFGLREAGQLGLTQQAFQFCAAISSVWMTTATPQLCKLRANNSTIDLQRLFSTRRSRAIATYIFATTIVITCGPLVLEVAGAKTHILPTPYLLTIAIIYLLELHHGPICAGLIMTTNAVPFVKSSIISGLSIALLSWTLAATTSLQLWSLIIAQGIIQLAFNNWYWPLQAIISLRPISTNPTNQ